MLNSIIMISTREKGYVIPMDKKIDGLVCVEHTNREQFYYHDDLEDDEEQNNSDGFFLDITNERCALKMYALRFAHAARANLTS